MSKDQERNQDGINIGESSRGPSSARVCATIGGARQLEPEPQPCLRSPMLRAELPPAWLLRVSRFGHRQRMR